MPISACVKPPPADHLSAPDIATELSVSKSTVKTHMRNLYAKLGAYTRAEAAGSARALSPARIRADRRCRLIWAAEGNR
jgi:LuxR family maltose regulon positive regulatory protein